MRKIFNYIASVALLVSFANAALASEGHYPSKYAVHQQQGPVCPFLPWDNLAKLRQIRERGDGHVVFLEQDYTTKLNSFARFLPRIHALDRTYDELRSRQGAYAEYEKTLRAEGIKESKRFDARGNFVEKIDWNPLNQARRPSYTPFNMESVDHVYAKNIRWMPILQDPDSDGIFFYDYDTGQTTPLKEIPPVPKKTDAEWMKEIEDRMMRIDNSEDDSEEAVEEPKVPGVNDMGMGDGNVKLYFFGKGPQGVEFQDKTFHFEPWMLDRMGVTLQEMKSYGLNGMPQLAGLKYGFCMLASSDTDLNKEYFYDVGSFQHMLFACGLKADNTSFGEDEDTLEARAFREYHQAMIANPLNPWAGISKEDLFEYHLAQIFKTNTELKKKAIESVGFYNDCWKFYKESFDLYDAPQEPRVKLSQKQRFMPGEDQMLAYLFSGQLRFVWAASISMDALIDVEELKTNLGETEVKLLKAGGILPGFPSAKDIVECSDKKQFGTTGLFRRGGYSFLDVWTDVKGILKRDVMDVLHKKDFVNFSSHGSVISLDDELIKLQNHEFRPTAEKLGFEMLDSTYEKGLKPFYQKAGSAEDVIEF
jgi:hypothetical protein